MDQRYARGRIDLLIFGLGLIMLGGAIVLAALHRDGDQGGEAVDGGPTPDESARLPLAVDDA